MAPTDGEPLDLMPPLFSEGLDDWSRGHGTPETPTYANSRDARLVTDDADFGDCLELRKIEPVQRLRYMGEVPMLRGACLEISARLKVVSAPSPRVRISAWPGGAFGLGIDGLATTGQDIAMPVEGLTYEARAVIARAPLPGVDLVWDDRVAYAHVGLDLIGADRGVVRIESVRVRDIAHTFEASVIPMRGFAEHPRNFDRDLE